MIASSQRWLHRDRIHLKVLSLSHRAITPSRGTILSAVIYECILKRVYKFYELSWPRKTNSDAMHSISQLKFASHLKLHVSLSRNKSNHLAQHKCIYNSTMNSRLCHNFLVLFLFILVICISAIATSRSTPPQNRTFSIDLDNNQFLKDGKPFRYVSGSVHYFRMVNGSWDSILKKMRLGGLNAIEIYVEWSSHQPKPDVAPSFDGNLDLFKFLQLAQKNDLLVIFRPGPYLDAERDMGGLPPWLLWTYPGIKLRTMDPDFKAAVKGWFDVLLPSITPYLYKNGGPIIMVQVENEYGGVGLGCDMNYKAWMRELIISHVGADTVLFTNDSPDDTKLKCGFIPGVMPTLDFAPETKNEVNAAVSILRKYWPKGPIVVSEYYPGWFDLWGKPHNMKSPETIATGLDNLLSTGANVNIYMYYGGTSFGFGSGSNYPDKVFDSFPTSYDYDAPLSEAGDPTKKYFTLKQVISKYMAVPKEDGKPSKKGKYGQLGLEPLVAVLDSAILKQFAPNPVTMLVPQSFEQLQVSAGFVVYETTVNLLTSDPSLLTITEFRDRAYVFVDEEFAGILSRTENITSLPIFAPKGSRLQILVESQGHPAWGVNIGENKGILGQVKIASQVLGQWTHYALGDFKHNTNEFMFDRLELNEFAVPRRAGMTFMASFTVGSKPHPGPLDTFIRVDGWRKGIVWINGFMLGRYWPVMGPQETLYLPSSLLHAYPKPNYLVLLELESVPLDCFKTLQNSSYSGSDNCFIELTDTHVINGPTPYGP